MNDCLWKLLVHVGKYSYAHQDVAYLNVTAVYQLFSTLTSDLKADQTYFTVTDNYSKPTAAIHYQCFQTTAMNCLVIEKNFDSVYVYMLVATDRHHWYVRGRTVDNLVTGCFDPLIFCQREDRLDVSPTGQSQMTTNTVHRQADHGSESSTHGETSWSATYKQGKTSQRQNKHQKGEMPITNRLV